MENAEDPGSQDKHLREFHSFTPTIFFRLSIEFPPLLPEV